MELIEKDQVLDTLNLLMGKSLVWIHDSNKYDEGDFGSRYILRVNEHLSNAVLLDMEELHTSQRNLLLEKDHLEDDDYSAMHLSFDDGHVIMSSSRDVYYTQFDIININVARCDREAHVKLSKTMSKFTITCYGKTKSYPESQRKKMMAYYLEGMACSDGSEQERYTLYLDLSAV